LGVREAGLELADAVLEGVPAGSGVELFGTAVTLAAALLWRLPFSSVPFDKTGESPSRGTLVG